MSLFEELDGIAEECREANWDGYNANPVSLEAIEYAKMLLRIFSEFVEPEVTPGPDGDISLEWLGGPKRAIVCVHKTDETCYIFISEEERWSMEEKQPPPYVPQKFLDMLRTHFKKEEPNVRVQS
jgi:hypothetical protein